MDCISTTFNFYIFIVCANHLSLLSCQNYLMRQKNEKHQIFLVQPQTMKSIGEKSKIFISTQENMKPSKALMAHSAFFYLFRIVGGGFWNSRSFVQEARKKDTRQLIIRTFMILATQLDDIVAIVFFSLIWTLFRNTKPFVSRLGRSMLSLNY